MDKKRKLAYDDTFRCVQCGYCLPVCPTYLTMGKETHSPRGRINLVKMAGEGKISLDQLQAPMELCLGCRACETVCPTNVEYGRILDAARETISSLNENKRSLSLKKLFYQYILPNQQLLRFIGSGLHFYQKTKMDQTVRKLGLTKILPKPLQALEKVTPTIPKKVGRQTVRKERETPLFRIGFFSGCVMDTVFSHVNDLSIQLLINAGCEVTVLKEQTCCGALHLHGGKKEQAIQLAKTNIETFEQYEFDYIVNSIGGCGATLMEYTNLFAKNDEWYVKAKQFSQKCVDISVILARLKLPFNRTISKVVTYQPSCHLKNVQNVSAEPITLLKSIPGVIFRSFEEMDICCGSAGVYNLEHYDEAMDILTRKMKFIQQTMPDIIVTTNPGCHLQMKLGVEREGLHTQIKVVHLIELLAEICEIGETANVRKYNRRLTET